ncbi:MAG: hypothetical protein R6V85_20270 [Polyangia bacterium]
MFSTRLLATIVLLAGCSAGPPGGEARPEAAPAAARAERDDDRSPPEAEAETDAGTNEGEPGADAAGETDAGGAAAVAAADAGAATDPAAEARVIRFSWRPKRGPAAAYEMEDPADRHRLVLTPGVREEGAYPVVIGFHGQPKRGKNPRDYPFMDRVQRITVEMVEAGEVRPLVLALPVFRFVGGNWPGFDPRSFASELSELLAERGIEAEGWYAFGHSGAAGCGGEGLNRAHRLDPEGVGFFDTCLGRGWRRELEELGRREVPTINVHSVETAGFRPRQRPEYQADFDFGRAYGPAGLDPVECPKKHPGRKLRELEHRCAASESQAVEGFVVDSGEGREAHQAVVEPALRFFLAEMVGK